MSEQIREQVSVFLDGELPSAETELLLRRLMRDGELRDSFGRYCLIGEAMRNSGAGGKSVSRTFASQVNARIDGEPAVATAASVEAPATRWWRPVAGAAVAASVAALAMVVLERRAEVPVAKVASAPAAVAAQPARATALPTGAKAKVQLAANRTSREAEIYTVPDVRPNAVSVLTPARLTSYVFAHSKYSSSLGQRGVLSGLVIDAPSGDSVETDSAPAVAPAR